MQKETENYILEYASSLPEGIKDALLSEDIGAKLQAIGDKNRLHTDQLDVLFTKIGEVLMGFTHPKDFSGKIARALGIGVDRAAEITKDINREIFDPVLQDIQGVYSDHQEREGELGVILKEAPENEDDLAHIQRSDLLSEIENPLPVGFRETPLPRSAAPNEAKIKAEVKTGQVAVPAANEPVLVAEIPEVPPGSAEMFTPPEIKLERPVINHSEEVSLSPEDLPGNPKTATRPARTDPYREPV